MAGHHVFVVDPMEYHICKFSSAVKHSYYSPAPSIDSQGYINTVKEAVQRSNIDLIIPLHEEIFYLAACGDKEILERLFAPKFNILYRLHNKWTFSELMRGLGLDVPESYLCKSLDDVRALDKNKEWAVKPVLGRACTGMHHLQINRKDEALLTIDVSNEKPYIAQEWIHGKNYCTYGVFRQGKMQAFAIYPVLETIDGSSCVYFQAVNHDGIHNYVQRIAEALHITGQLAFDLIETGVEGKGEGGYRGFHSIHRLVAIECNPRATSGIHLWSRTPLLANVFTSGIPSPYAPTAIMIGTGAPSILHQELRAQPGSRRQVAPGMLMWEHKNANFKRYLEHMKRLVQTRDVIWSWTDIGPMLMEPFLLTSYYEICRERGGMALPDM
jgi:hypothetical protein